MIWFGIGYLIIGAVFFAGFQHAWEKSDSDHKRVLDPKLLNRIMYPWITVLSIFWPVALIYGIFAVTFSKDDNDK